MNIFDKLDEAQARLDELSKATLGRYIKSAHNDEARHKKASDNMNIARRAIDDISYSSGVRSIKQPEGEKASHEVLNHAGHIMRKASLKHDDKAYNRRLGIHRAMSRLTKEDMDLVESAEELQELSKETLRSYTANASATLAGRGRKSAKKLQRASSIDLAKEKLSKILDKEWAAREKTRTAHAQDIQQHFTKEAPKVLAKHGFSKIHSTENSTVYHKGHDNGHSTLVRLSHKHDSNYSGSKFSMHSTSGSGTLNGHNHTVDHSESAEHNKTKMMNGFESHLIDDHDHHKRWVHEEVDQTGEVLKESENLDELSKPLLGRYVKANRDNVVSMSPRKKIADDPETPENYFKKRGSPFTTTEVSKRYKDKFIKRGIGFNRAINRLTKEETELEEGRRGRPPKDPTKRAAFNSAESDEPGMHIIAQLNKVKVSSSPIKVHFKDGTKHELHPNHAEHILAKYSGMKPNEKIDFQKRIAQSHASLKNELK